MADHPCPVPGCSAGVAGSSPMCERHWAMVPAAVQERLHAAARAALVLPHEAVLDRYHAVRRAAVASVTVQAGGI